ncbi:MAG: hypothetical protein EOP83_19965 [Verrucomicrobiaceae bacterium]|nr:MAG: hypothetical protein EOP83_19965 [Verrucomicrobiaceae bacterium]
MADMWFKSTISQDTLDKWHHVLMASTTHLDESEISYWLIHPDRSGKYTIEGLIDGMHFWFSDYRTAFEFKMVWC